MRERILTVLEKNARIKTDDLAGVLGEDLDKVKEEVNNMENKEIANAADSLRLNFMESIILKKGDVQQVQTAAWSWL